MKFTEYSASDVKLTPSDIGYSAFETAGRRLGPLYDQAAQDVKEGGALQGQADREEGWPLAFARFQLARDNVSIKFANGGGGRGGGGRALSYGGGGRSYTRGGGRSPAPFLSQVARRMAAPKPMVNTELAQQNNISDAANEWYYGRTDPKSQYYYGKSDPNYQPPDPTGAGSSLSDPGNPQYTRETDPNASAPYDPGTVNTPAQDAGIPYDNGGAAADASAASDSSGSNFWNDITTAQ